MRPVAGKEDRFTFGLWTVRWLGREKAAARGMHYERLDQLAMERLLGAR